jgi:hypothetical protein
MTKFNHLLSNYPDWVDAAAGEVHVPLFHQIYEFDKNQASMISTNSLRGMRQYSGRTIPTLNASGYMSDVDVNGQLNMSPSVSKNSFNLTAACIDTLTAKLASIQATPQSVTNKGRQLAEELNYLLKGIFHKFQVSHLINLAYRDAMINRAGYIKVLPDEDKGIKLDRVMVDEIIIDPADGYYNDPYKMIHRKAIPVHIMLKKYPKFEQKIKDCQVQEVRQYNTRNFTPCILVAEAWCRNAYIKDGRHVLSIENADLIDEKWDKDYFPIVKCDYSEPAVGWLGNSVVDELATIQQEIDRILVTMQAIMKVMSVPKWLVDTNSQMNKNHMTNKVGLIIEYDGKQGIAPILHNGAAMPPELLQSLEMQINNGYSRVGLTPMDTQGQSQKGVDSGEALKTMTDIKSERWRLLQNNYEQTHVKVAEIILKELRGKDLTVSALDRHIGLKEISTKVIPNTDDSYVIKIFPVSSLPDSIPDLIDSVEKMSKLGVIQPSQIPELFKMPDLDAYVAMQSAPRKYIELQLEGMLESGKYVNPEPYDDLDFSLGLALQHYSWARMNKEPEKSLKLLRRYINDVKTLLAQRQPPVQPANAQGVTNAGTNPTNNPQPTNQPIQGGGTPL